MQNPRYAIRVSKELHDTLIERGPDAVRKALTEAFAPLTPEAALWGIAIAACADYEGIPDTVGEALAHGIEALDYHRPELGYIDEWKASAFGQRIEAIREAKDAARCEREAGKVV